MRNTLKRASVAVLCSLPGALLCGGAQAAETAPGPGVGSVLQMILGLGLVLAAFFGVVWLMKRSGAIGGGGQQMLKLVGTLAVSARERIVVVEVGNQWIVAGVAPGSVSPLACLPRGETGAIGAVAASAPAASFAGFLRQVTEKRNAK